jgi:hypothetical protein
MTSPPKVFMRSVFLSLAALGGFWIHAGIYAFIDEKRTILAALYLIGGIVYCLCAGISQNIHIKLLYKHAICTGRLDEIERRIQARKDIHEQF